MYYKVKVNKKTMQFINVVNKAKYNDGFLYLTPSEFFQLNPKAFDNYDDVLKLGDANEIK